MTDVNAIQWDDAPAAPAAVTPAIRQPSAAAPAAAQGVQWDDETPAASAPAAAPTIQQPRSWARAAGDTAVGLGEGAVSATLAIPQIANTLTGGAVDKYVWQPVTGAADRLAGGTGEGRTLAESSQDTRAALDELKSPQLRQAEQQLADTKGFLPSAKAILTNPMLLGQQVAEQVPQFLAPAGAARAVGARALERVGGEALAKGTAKRVAAGMGAEEAAKLAMPAAQRLGARAASKAAGRAVMATGGAIGASQASEQAQQDVLGMDQKILDANPEYQAMRAQGVSDIDARRQLAITAGMKAAAIALPLDTLASGLTARLEGNIFRGETGVHGVGGLLSRRGAAGIAKTAGKEAAEETLQEGGEQFAQNVGAQGVDPNRNLMDQVPEQAALGGAMGLALGAGGFAGSAALSRPNTHTIQRPKSDVPNPGAAPGSLSDAANVLSQPATGPVGRAAQAAVVSGATAAVQQTASTEAAPAPAPAPAPRTEPAPVAPPVAVGAPPWADPTTGELRAPTKGQLTTALADHILQTYQQNGHMRINPQAVADAWGVPKADVNRVRQRATSMASDQVAAAERAAMNPATTDMGNPISEPATTAEPGTTASMPFMITQAMRSDLRALGHTDADIATMTPADANAALDAAKTGASDGNERVPGVAAGETPAAGAEAASPADEQPAANADGGPAAGTEEPVAAAPAAVAGGSAAADANPALTTDTAKEPNADAQQPRSTAEAPGAEGAAAPVAGEGGAEAAGAEGAGEAQQAAAPPGNEQVAPDNEQIAPQTTTTKTPPTGGVSASGGSAATTITPPAAQAATTAPSALTHIETVGAKGIRLHGDVAALRAQLAAGGFKKKGTLQKGALRFDAKDRPAIEAALQPKPTTKDSSVVAPATFKPSTAGRVAETLRVKTPEGGELNGRRHVDKLVADGYTKLQSVRAGDKMVHSLVNAAGESQPLHARQLRYAEEATAKVESHAAEKSAAVAVPAQHIEPGEPPAPATPAVISESAQKVAPTVGMNVARKELLRQIDEVAAKAPSEEDDGKITLWPPHKENGHKVWSIGMARTLANGLDVPSLKIVEGTKAFLVYHGREQLASEPSLASAKFEAERMLRAADWKAKGKSNGKWDFSGAKSADYVVLDVPGDGKFKVLNTRERLAAFRKEVEAKFKQPGAAKVPNDGTGESRSLRMSDTTRAAILSEAELVDEAAHEAATSPQNDRPEPTEGQKEAGNYKLGHVNVHGLDISIENPRGSTRSGVGENGKPWSHVMSDHYGYVRGTVGADGDHVDVYVGPALESDRVFVVDQIDQKTGAFDEHKVMLGFAKQGDAIAAYKSNFDKGWKVGRVTGMSVDEFKAWLKDGDTKAPLKPVDAKATTQPTEPSKLKNFGWDAVKLSEYSNDELNALRAEVEREHANPGDVQSGYTEGGRQTLHLYDKKGRRKLDALAWAVTYKLQESRAERERVAAEIAAGAPPPKAPEPVQRVPEPASLPTQTSEPAKPLQMTMEEWKAVHKDFKGVIDGQRTMLRDGRVVPVEIIKQPGVAKRGGIATNGAKVLTVGGKLEYVQGARETLEAYFKPGNVLLGYGGHHDKVLAFDWNGGEWSVTVQRVNADGSPLAAQSDDARPRKHATAPDRRDLLKVLGKPEIAAKAAPAAEPTAAAPQVGAIQAAGTALNAARDGSATVADLQAAFARLRDSKEEAKAELDKQSKIELRRNFGLLRDDTKPRLVSMAYRDSLNRFALGKPVSYMMGGGNMNDAHLAALQKIVDGLTDADLAAYAGRVAEARAELDAKIEGVKNPQTVEDYQLLSRTKGGEAHLSPEQRAHFDALRVEERKAERAAQAERNSVVRAVDTSGTGMTLVETKHTKKGHDLFVVQLSDRVERDVYTQLNAAAKKLGGYYSSFRGAGAVPGFQFTTRDAADKFMALREGDQSTTEERAARDEQKRAERSETLADKAAKLRAKAEASLGHERKDNTRKRAAQAASAEATARTELAMASTMDKIAAAQTAGTAGLLDQVRHVSQVQLIDRSLKNAAWESSRDQGVSWEKFKDAPITPDMLTNAELPSFRVSRDQMVPMVRQLLETRGGKAIGTDLAKLIDYGDEYAAAVQENPHRFLVHKSTGGHALFDTKAEAARALAASPDGLKGVVLKMPTAGRGKNVWAVALAPELAIERKLWMPDSDKKVALSESAAKKISDLLGSGYRSGVPYWFESHLQDRARYASMGITKNFELREALRKYLTLRDEPAGEDVVRKLERAIQGNKSIGVDFFPTPPALAKRLVEQADIGPGMRVLEPSAGKGDIADAIRNAADDVQVDTVEMSHALREILEAKGYEVAGQDFDDFTPSKPYDRIVMNPPFSSGLDADHVQRAYTMLAPGGRLVAITGEGIFSRNDKKATAFREWLDKVQGTDEKLPDGSFKSSFNPTGVNTRMVVIDKASADEQTAAANVAFSQAATEAQFRRSPSVDGSADVPDTAAQAAHTAKIKAIATELTQAWQGDDVPRVQVVATPEHLPQIAKVNPVTGAPDNSYKNARGMYDGRTVWIVASKHADTTAGRKVIASTLAHEAVGHYGVDRIITRELGEGAWAKTEASIERLRNDKTLGSPAMRSVLDNVERRYKQQDGTPADAATFARETLAVMAERGVKNGILDRAITALRRFIRRMFPGLNLSEHELRNLLVRSKEFIERGETQQQRVQSRAALAFQRTVDTKEAYDARIDALFAGEKPARQGAKVLDRADILDLLGYGDGPLHLAESSVGKRVAGRPKHQMTAADWKKVPEWIENPVAAFRSQTMPGRIVLFGPELVNGRPVRIILQPNADMAGLNVHVAVNAYDESGTHVTPVDQWVKNGDLLYLDQKLSPALSERSGLRLPRDVRQLRGYKQRVMTEQDLVKYRSEHPESNGSQFSREDQTDTPAFRAFFGDSKVVDAAGNPLPVYHGTNEEFDTFDPQRSGSATAHMTANLGTFFAEDQAKAKHYAENASDGVPAEERVVDAYLAIRNPYEMSLKQFMAIDSQEESQALRERLVKEGHDGIHLNDIGQWVAFQPNQIKSASENRGTFDTGTGNIYFSRDDADPDNPKPKPRPFGDASASIEAIHDTLPQLDTSNLQAVKDWIAGKARDLEPLALGGLQLRHVLELASEDPTLKKPATSYADLYQRMDGDRNSMTTEGAAKVDALQKWAKQPGAAGWLGKIRPEAAALFKFMHAVTQLAVDPTSQYEKLLMRDAGNEYKPWTPDLIKQRIKVLRETALTRSGDDKTRLFDEIKDLQRLPQRERVRKERYPQLVAQWNALTPEAKHHFEVMREHYQAQSAALEEATIQQLNGLDIPDAAKRTALQMVRNNFREAKVDGVYFPLSRFGDYWMSVRTKDGEYVFAKYENAQKFAEAEKRFLASGAEIEARGRQDNNYRAKDAPSGTFIGDLMGVLKNAPDKVKDEIYQMYLKTLPNLSLRKHGIHRANVAGYTDDVPRAFAGSVFHGAHQISKARYGWQLQATLEQMRERMEARRTVITASQAAHGDALLGELSRRHDWIMNPSNSQLANKMTSIGFSYFLAASPASALVNLIQTPQIVLPVLGARHGWGKASRMLGAAMRDAIRTGGNIGRVLTGEDQLAFKALQEQGTFQRSATHALAGISEGDQLRSSPAYTKVMNAVSWMFHTSEVINREGTGIAAFRLARSEGKSFEDAVKYADEITNGTHGDYSNANRARFMQGDVAKVVLQFKNYSLAMSWLWGRNFYKAFKGETPEVKALARRTLTGMLGMTGLFAGVVGMPIFNLLRYGMQAVHAATGDDDEPWDFMTEFRSWLAEHLGDTAANIIANGAASQLGANVASRVSMSDLWFRDADRQLEGEDAYNAMLQAIAGPLGGMIKNMYVGTQQFNEGHTWRGIETMLPSAAKNAMKAMRYASQGANTLRGDPIVADISTPQALIQAIGFQPTRVAEQQRINNALYTYQQFIQDRRQGLMNAFAMAQQAGDDDGRADTLRRIQAFNAKYPEIAIGIGNLRASLRTRAQRSAQSENGIMLNRKLAGRVRQEVGALAGE